jgi:hypothetical protein
MQARAEHTPSPWVCEVCMRNFAPEPWLELREDPVLNDANALSLVALTWLHLGYGACICSLVVAIVQVASDLVQNADSVLCLFGRNGWLGLWGVGLEACAFFVSALVMLALSRLRVSRCTYRVVCSRILTCMLAVLIIHMHATVYTVLMTDRYLMCGEACGWDNYTLGRQRYEIARDFLFTGTQHQPYAKGGVPLAAPTLSHWAGCFPELLPEVEAIKLNKLTYSLILMAFSEGTLMVLGVLCVHRTL